jgi:hypothetical protein
VAKFAGGARLPAAGIEESSMGRNYAAVLGILAFSTTLARGLVHGSGLQATLETAIGQSIAFAAVGWIIGESAAWIVEDSVRSELKTDSPGTTPANVDS